MVTIPSPDNLLQCAVQSTTYKAALHLVIARLASCWQALASDAKNTSTRHCRLHCSAKLGILLDVVRVLFAVEAIHSIKFELLSAVSVPLTSSGSPRLRRGTF